MLPRPAPTHRRKDLLDQAIRHEEVLLEESLPLGFVHVPAGRAAAGADVGDEAVEGAPPLADGLEQARRDGLRIAQVAVVCRQIRSWPNSASEARRGRRQRCAVTSGDHGPLPFRQEGTRRGQADAARRAGDEDDLVRQAEVHAMRPLPGARATNSRLLARPGHLVARLAASHLEDEVAP